MSGCDLQLPRRAIFAGVLSLPLWTDPTPRKNHLRGVLGALLGAPAEATPATLTAVLTPSGLASALTPANIAAFAKTAAPRATQIIIDQSKTDQAFVGVGAALTDSAVFCLTTYLTQAQRTALFTEMFGTNGLSTVRLCMGSSDFSRNTSYYTYADNGGTADPRLASFSVQPDIDRGIVPLALEILAINSNVKFIAAPWSPPAWLKSNSAIVNGFFAVNAANMTTWADYFVKFIQAYRALGIPIAYVTPQNEPNVSSSNYPCCGWTAADINIFVKRHLGPAFESAGLATKILMGDADWTQTPAYATTALGDAATSPYVAGSAWHGYVGTPATETAVHKSFPAKEMHFTEYRTLLSQSLDAAQAQMAGDSIIGNMRNGCQSVTFWNMALDQAGNPVAPASTGRRGVIVIQNDGSGTITRTPDYYALAHIGRYVKRGALKVASSSPASYSTGKDIETVAWLNPDGSTVVFIWNGAVSDKSIALTDGRSGRISDNFTVTARSMVTVIYPQLPAKAALAISGEPAATAGPSPYSFTPAVSGGVPVYTFALAGALPSGLSFNTATGAIMGTPTADGAAFGLSITATDQVGATSTLGPFSIAVSRVAAPTSPPAQDAAPN